MNLLHPIPQKYTAFNPLYLIATWFHSGRLKPASGTWGSLAALPFVYVVIRYVGLQALPVATGILFTLGYFAAQDYVTKTGEKDASPIVIDEVVGISIALLPAGLDPKLWLIGFVLFRIFDAVKIGPVGWCDRKLPGAYGVMIDDVVAGIMAAVGVWLFSVYVL